MSGGPSDRAAIAARELNDAVTRDYVLRDLQAGGIRTFTISKEHPTWIFLTLEVEREAVVGERWQIEDALLDSEESSTLDTSFLECAYNFVRPHRTASSHLCHPVAPRLAA